MALSWSVLELDPGKETERVCAGLRAAVVGLSRKRGAVVAISGGVDSGVCAALAARALGPQRLLGLILPERESSTESAERARALIAQLGIPSLEQDITATLEALGCYRWRDEAARRVLPAYGPGWRMKIALAGGLDGRINHYRLIAQAPDGARHEARLGLREYLEIVAATSFKQRVRKTLEYFHADRLNYAVIGTPNRLEYDQGFFVKNGDGAADIKPIAHLYKSQVYALAAYLELPAGIATAPPTTDTLQPAAGPGRALFRAALQGDGPRPLGLEPRHPGRAARRGARGHGGAGPECLSGHPRQAPRSGLPAPATGPPGSRAGGRSG